MVKIAWDEVGERTFHSGVDRGILFVNRGRAVPWNGLTNVTISASDPSLESYYLDGEKINSYRSREELAGTLSALTYPDEFDWFQGHRRQNGVGYYAQPRLDRFHISWRTFVGNDLNIKRYKIHILYNCTANVSTRSYKTVTNTQSLEEMQWELECLPENVLNLKRTAYVVFDTKFVKPEGIADIEDLLYGTERTSPSLPSGTLLDAIAKGESPLDLTRMPTGMNPVNANIDGGLKGSKSKGLYNITDRSDLIYSTDGLHRLV